MIKIAQPLISEETIKKVNEVLRSGNLVQGKFVEQFEKEFANYIGTKYAVAVGNGTQALHLALKSLKLGEGDEVITTDFTFISGYNCLRLMGCTPVTIGVACNFCLETLFIPNNITPKTKAIIVTHLFGQPADMDEIMDIAEESGLRVVEDACQSHGALYKGKKVGGIGDVGCFSFYPSKNMTTMEGGMITTDNPLIDAACRVLRNHGQVGPYRYDAVGYNYRMTEVQAVIGLEQLKMLDEWNLKRIDNAQYYLSNLPEGICPEISPDRLHVFNQFTLSLENRDDMKRSLEEAGIETRIYYPPYEVLSIPVHPFLSVEDLKYIVEKIKENL